MHMRRLGLLIAVAHAACFFDPTGAQPGSDDTDVSEGGESIDITGAEVSFSSTDPTTDPLTTTNPPTTATTTTEPDTTSTTGDAAGFVFREDPPEAYTQIDRHGAVEAGTVGIAAAAGLGFTGGDIKIRDAYNASSPAEDAGGMWLGELANSLVFFHDALDDDIVMIGLVPATFDESNAQAGPVVVPDTIKYDPTKPTAYPNGRKLEDPVVDITLAAMLLKIGPDQPLSLLASVPVNPPENDVPFLPEFPYLAPPHLAP